MADSIYDDNDFVEIAGPIRGRDPVTGALVLYHGNDVVAFIAATADSNAPIAGGLSYSSVEIGATGKYPVAFDGAAITAALSGLPAGTTVHRVIRAPGNFRVVDALTYQKTRPSD